MTETQTGAGPLSGTKLDAIDAWWRAPNYLSVGQIYLMGNPLLAVGSRTLPGKAGARSCSEPSLPRWPCLTGCRFADPGHREAGPESASRRMTRVGATWNFGGMGCVAVAGLLRRGGVSLHFVAGVGPRPAADRQGASRPAEQALADRARKLRTGIRVLYMSGLPASAPEPGRGQIQFIRKPSTAQDLLEKVHAALDATPVSGAQPTASDGSVTSMITASAAYSRSAEPGGLMLISGTNAGAFTAARSLTVGSRTLISVLGSTGTRSQVICLVTTDPAPRRRRISPSAASCPSTLAAVMRDTPYRAASWLSLGTASPSPGVPARMASRSCHAIQAYGGIAESPSMAVTITYGREHPRTRSP
jgi:hypothetical protein